MKELNTDLGTINAMIEKKTVKNKHKARLQEKYKIRRKGIKLVRVEVKQRIQAKGLRIRRYNNRINRYQQTDYSVIMKGNSTNK